MRGRPATRHEEELADFAAFLQEKMIVSVPPADFRNDSVPQRYVLEALLRQPRFLDTVRRHPNKGAGGKAIADSIKLTTHRLPRVAVGETKPTCIGPPCRLWAGRSHPFSGAAAP